MCIFPILAVKICVLVIIPITSVFCLTEILITITILDAENARKDLLYLILVASTVYLMALAVGYYGCIVENTICLRLLLFANAAYILIKIFISIVCSISSEYDKRMIINFWFHCSVMGSVLSLFFAFVYFLRLKELLDDDN